MKPYYEHGGITIYHGDCREVLPMLDRVDLVLTDPPYNCGKEYGQWNDSLPVGEYEAAMSEIVALCLGKADNQFWVAPRYQLRFWLGGVLPTTHLIAIKRGASGPYRGGWLDQFEVALAVGKPLKAEPDLWEGIRLKGEGYFFRENTYGHPGYTPYPIMVRALLLLSEKSIIDPFSGTGTSLYAAKLNGRKAIGIEIEEKYCEIAARRLAQEVLEFGGAR